MIYGFFARKVDHFFLDIFKEEAYNYTEQMFTIITLTILSQNVIFRHVTLNEAKGLQRAQRDSSLRSE